MMKNALLTMAVAAACFSYGAQADEKTGGDIVVTYQNDVATLDPAIGYDWQNWSMIKSLFDGLMDYRPGTTELVNDWRRATPFPRTARSTPLCYAKG